MSHGGSPPRHYCDHADCGKSFRRAEHLTRHKLNHTNSTIPCPRCDRLFYRKDLLQRHLTLKHGKTARRSNRRAEYGTSPRQAEVPSPDSRGSAQSPTRSTHMNNAIDRSSQLPAANVVVSSSTDSSSVNQSAVEDAALLIPDNMFPLASPRVDPMLDWGWLQQYSLPVLPVVSNPVGQINNNGLTDLQVLINDWMNPENCQDLYISQEIYEFLTTLGPVIESNRPLTPQDVSSILNNAFLFIMESLPIFHQPTFNFDLIQRQLCFSIFSIGLLIAPEPTLHQTGCILLGQIRSELLHYVNNHTIYRADLGILQAMLLVELAGVYLADRAAVELSDIFHGTLTTLSRRLGLFELASTHARGTSALPPGSEWQNAAEHESAKRLAHFIFALDVEHALLFGHERSILSVYSMKLELPSEEGDWQLPRLATLGKQHKLYNLCYTLLSPTESSAPELPNLTQLSNFILLLGLASVALDLLRRPQDPFYSTKLALSRLGVVLPAVHSRLMAGPDGPAKLHGRTVYHVTAIALCTPLNDLELAANDGFSRTGRTPQQHTRAAIIRLLTKHRVNADPARHAVHLLRLYLVLPESAEVLHGSPSFYNATSTYSRYEPSALYLGVLTLWAYIIGRANAEEEDDLEDSYSPGAAGSALNPEVPIAAVLDAMEAAIDNDNSSAGREHWRRIVQHVATALAQRRNCNAQEYSQVVGSLSDNLSV